MGPVPIRHEEVNALSQDQARAPVIGHTQNLAPDQVLRLAADLGYAHVLQRDGLEYDRELASSEMLLQTPENFFKFPVGSIFQPQKLGGESESAYLMTECLFHSSTQKREVLEKFTETMEHLGLNKSLVEDTILVADEMFTNAIFNAPFVDQVTRKNLGISRQDVEVNLDPNRPGRIFMAQDQKRLMVACEDPYGSLNLTEYLVKIKATYERGAAATMNFGSGGAGLGSYIIFNTGAGMYVGVRSGRATIIACVLPLGMSNRKRALLPKHLHWIQL